MNERAIFTEALEKETAAQRSSYLDEACAGDAALRCRVEALLKSHAEAGSFLGKPVPERLAEARGTPASSGATQGEVGESRGDDLGFLAPSDRPDSLGRLGHYEVL